MDGNTWLMAYLSVIILHGLCYSLGRVWSISVIISCGFRFFISSPGNIIGYECYPLFLAIEKAGDLVGPGFSHFHTIGLVYDFLWLVGNHLLYRAYGCVVLLPFRVYTLVSLR
jgi:hypothetical protein